MVAEAFIIRELTGSQREVRLLNRSLPYRPVAWSGTQHYVQHWYPGNRQATLQILGPRESNLEIKGTWKTRFIAQDAFVVGFDDLIPAGEDVTAELLTQVFHRIRIAGNLVEVRWGPEVRRGILASFDPNYQRVEDVEWSMTFAWSQRDERPTPRASVVRDPVRPVQAAMNSLDDAVALQPTGLNVPAVQTVTDAVDAVRRGVSSFTSALVQVQGAAQVTRARVQQVQTIARQIVDAGRALRQGSIDLPYTDFLPIDDVAAVFNAEEWRRTVGRESTNVEAETLRALRQIEGDTIPDILATVTVVEGTTLRQLAQEYYGDADSWVLIADANGIVQSVVPAGTIVVIPRQHATGPSVLIDTTQASFS